MKANIIAQMRAVVNASQANNYKASEFDCLTVKNLENCEFPVIWHCPRNSNVSSRILKLNRMFHEFSNRRGNLYLDYIEEGCYPMEYIWTYGTNDMYFIIDRNGLHMKNADELETIVRKMFNPIIAQIYQLNQ